MSHIFHQIPSNPIHAKWEYTVPPRWLTDIISSEILRQELDNINNIAKNNTPETEDNNGGCLLFTGLMLSPCIIGIPMLINGKQKMEKHAEKIRENAIIGREKAIEYIHNQLNDKYKHKNIVFTAKPHELFYTNIHAANGFASTTHSVATMYDIIVTLSDKNEIENDQQNIDNEGEINQTDSKDVVYN